MINQIILTILFLLFLSGISYVFLKLKEETNSKKTSKSEELQITPEEVLLQVKTLLDSGDKDTAQKLGKKYLDKNPEHHELRRLLIKTYMDQKKEYEAINNLCILTKFFPDDLDIFCQLATLYKNTHQHKKAMHYYAYILGKDQYNVLAMKNLADLYYNNKQKESALKMYKQLVSYIDDENEKVDYYKRMGNIYLGTNENEKALTLYKKVLDIQPENIEAIQNSRKIYLKLKDTDNVLYYTRKLIDLDPENYNYYREIIELLFHIHQYNEALEYAQKALELEQKDIFEVKNMIAKIYIYTNKIQDGINLINETILEDPANLYLNQTLAMAYCMQKDFETAMKVCNEALDVAMPSDVIVIHNNMSTILAEQAVYLLEQGKNKEGFDKFTEALQYNNENPEIYYKLSNANRNIKNYSEAIRQCKRAIELAPEVSQYYETLADIYYELQNDIEAKKHYKEAVFIDPRNARAHSLLGILQAKDKENESAKKSLETAASLEPDNCDIRYNLALVYELSGDIERASAEYHKVLELNPNHQEAKNNLKLLGEET